MNLSTRSPILILVVGLLALAAPLSAQDDTEAQADAPQWLEGRGENEILFIHGLGANKTIWQEVTPYLAGSFDIHLYELHGHGETPVLESPTIDVEVVALRAWIEEQGLIYPTIVGHGMGGMIALQYTLDHPADVQRLIVMDAGPKQIASDDYKTEVAQALLDDYDQFVASHFVGISPIDAVNDKAVDMALRTDSATFASLLLSSFNWDITDRLPRQSVPMLVVGSAAYLPEVGYEQEFLTAYGYGSARALSFKRIDETGHYMMLEKPSYLASVISVYIRQEEM